MRTPFIAIFTFGMAVLASGRPSVTYKRVVLSKRTVYFELKPEERERAEFCPSNVCSCEADVEYVELVGDTTLPRLGSTNKQLKADVRNVHCDYLDSIDTVQETVSHLSDRFVSVIERFVSGGIHANGSCHGSSSVHTFDLRSGKEYFVADVVPKESLERLRFALPASIVAERNRQEYEQLKEEFNRPLCVHEDMTVLNEDRWLS